jgi:hypothetical protein
MTTLAGVEGFAPVVGTTQGNPEALKYGELWGKHPVYRTISPGEQLAQLFLAEAKPKPGSTCIDFGCGTGRGGLALALFGKLNVTMVDFVKNCLDDDVKQMCETQSHTLRFLKKDLEQPMGIVAQYGYCTDVMEHIPPDKVDQVLDRVLGAAEHVFFSISLTDDRCGALIGQPLHLTVQPYEWWLEKFQKRNTVVHWSRNLGDMALFYVSDWCSGDFIVSHGTLNESVEQIRENVRVNVGNGWAQVKPYQPNDMEVMILGGGWSLPQHLEEIRQKREDGVKLVTLNGTYNWALEHGLSPSAQIVVDARPFNARFTKPVHETCRYLIASQCHPSVLEGLPKERTMLWHTMYDDIKDLVGEQFKDGLYPVPSCTTVMVTSIPLLRMLGFQKFHLYGCDSCVSPDKSQHHAYEQKENDGSPIVPVSVTGGRIFWCNPWMVAQAQQFMEMLKLMKDEVEIAVYGDGLLKHILDVGAEMADLETEDAPLDDAGVNPHETI